MAGLLNKQPGMPPQQPSVNDPNAEEGTNVSPEDQRQYDRFVTNGMKLIYDPKAMPQLLQTIAGGGNPVQGIANALATVVMRLEDSAGKQGQQIDGDVELHGATELMEQMIELAETAGIHEYTPEEIESAYYLAIDTYRVAKQEKGTLPVEALTEDFTMLQQANEQGTLDEMFPGIQQVAEKAPQPEPSKGMMRR